MTSSRGYRLSDAELYNLVGQEARLSNCSELGIVAETAYCLAVAWLIGHPGDRVGCVHTLLLPETDLCGHNPNPV